MPTSLQKQLPVIFVLFMPIANYELLCLKRLCSLLTIWHTPVDHYFYFVGSMMM